MGFLPPLTGIPLGALLIVETWLLGLWWGRRRSECPKALYLRTVTLAGLYGLALWLITRGLAIHFK